MAFLGHLDAADEFLLHGWAHSEALPKLSLYVDIVINRRLVCRLLADSYRHDIEAAGFGDGRKAFSFNPFEYLSAAENLVEVYVSGTDQLLYGGRRVLPDLSSKEQVSSADPSSKPES